MDVRVRHIKTACGYTWDGKDLAETMSNKLIAFVDGIISQSYKRHIEKYFTSDSMLEHLPLRCARLASASYVCVTYIHLICFYPCKRCASINVWIRHFDGISMKKMPQLFSPAFAALECSGRRGPSKWFTTRAEYWTFVKSCCFLSSSSSCLSTCPPACSSAPTAPSPTTAAWGRPSGSSSPSWARRGARSQRWGGVSEERNVFHLLIIGGKFLFVILIIFQDRWQLTSQVFFRFAWV